MKFICNDDVPVYFDLSKINSYQTLKDAVVFKEIFSNNNLDKFNDVSGNILLKTLNVSCTDWLELISFIKNNKPMYYSLDVMNDPNKKESFIYNLEKLNKTVNKFGGLNSFDKFYQDFIIESNKNVFSYYCPLEPSKDYKDLFLWGIGGLNNTNQMITTFSKYTGDKGWSTTKTFVKSNEVYVWFRKTKEIPQII